MSTLILSKLLRPAVRIKRLSLGSIAVAGLVALWMVPAAAQEPIDFSHQIVPILKEHCGACHTGHEAKGSFSMNTRPLLVDSGMVDLDDPQSSYLLELVASEDPDLQMPPPGRPRVPAEQQQLLSRWLAEGAAWESGFSFAPQAYEPPLLPRRPELPPVGVSGDHPVDRLLDAYLAEQGLPTPAMVDDATFARRVWLDLVGLLPPADQLQRFLADPAGDKRQRLVDRLLADEIAYADHWLSFYNDLFRNDYSGTGFITGGRSQITGWLYRALLENRPFDQMARELIAPTSDASRGYSSGIRWRGEVSAGQTVEIQFAQSVGQSFLGINMKCASCHDSFIDRWTLDDAYGLAAIYSEKPMEIHRCDAPIGRMAVPAWPFPEIGQVDPGAPPAERLAQLASLMTHPDNGRFSRTIVNRLWYRLMGRGIVHPLDAMQTPPWSEELLDYLAARFSDDGYDLKRLLQLIATSRAYAGESVEASGEGSQSSGGDESVYVGPVSRRLTAEQFIDAVWQLTGAAPLRFDAPLERRLASRGDGPAVELAASWIWGTSAARGRSLPAANEAIAVRRQFDWPADAEGAAVVVACDNRYWLFVNDSLVGSGSDWGRPDAISLQQHLRPGRNQILLIAQNLGEEPNPAGLIVELIGRLPDGTAVRISSDAAWEFSPRQGERVEDRASYTGPWEPAVVVGGPDAWGEPVQTELRQWLQQLAGQGLPMVRAGLMKNDFLMRSLGRPMRDQIVSMRPEGLTTLEAIDLSNGQQLADMLTTGARGLLARFGNDWEAMVQHVFWGALSRPASEQELGVLGQYFGRPLDSSQVEDFLWSVMVSPEFMFVR